MTDEKTKKYNGDVNALCGAIEVIYRGYTEQPEIDRHAAVEVILTALAYSIAHIVYERIDDSEHTQFFDRMRGHMDAMVAEIATEHAVNQKEGETIQ